MLKAEEDDVSQTLSLLAAMIELGLISAKLVTLVDTPALDKVKRDLPWFLMVATLDTKFGYS